MIQLPLLPLYYLQVFLFTARCHRNFVDTKTLVGPFILDASHVN